MKSRKQFLTTMGLGITGAVLGNNKFNDGETDLPQLEFAFSAKVTLDKIQDLGNTPHGHRRIIPITGGSFEGPAIKGSVVPGGADWQIIRADGVVELSAQYTLQTDDGALIYITNKGYRNASPEVTKRIANGEMVDPKEYYFRTTPFFETASVKYDYLNNHIFICTAERKVDYVLINFYKVL
ncbi:MAG TPA: DUF3237 domain-containing protein [Panacibacter sp.]|nr:DUF3237 domain-containing protein [Panacibacter sp.]